MVLCPYIKALQYARSKRSITPSHGEIAALKKNDIIGCTVYVKRTEISYQDDDGNYVYEVRDFPKTQAGVRPVIFPDNCRWILCRIKEMSSQHEYLFERNGERMRAHIFRRRLKRICANLEIKQKSPHKIRKTYGSILLDSGVPESLVIKQMGHVDVETTKGYYYRNMRKKEQQSDVINHIVGL